MSTFDDTYTPLPPVTETPVSPPAPNPVYTSWGSFTGLIKSTPISVLDALIEASGFQPYNYGIATALMVQEDPLAPSGAGLIVYPTRNGVGFTYEDPTRGPFANPAPFFIARNRAQLENLQIASTGADLGLRFQFYTGNPNVGI